MIFRIASWRVEGPRRILPEWEYCPNPARALNASAVARMLLPPDLFSPLLIFLPISDSEVSTTRLAKIIVDSLVFVLLVVVCPPNARKARVSRHIRSALFTQKDWGLPLLLLIHILLYLYPNLRRITEQVVAVRTRLVPSVFPEHRPILLLPAHKPDCDAISFAPVCLQEVPSVHLAMTATWRLLKSLTDERMDFLALHRLPVVPDFLLAFNRILLAMADVLQHADMTLILILVEVGVKDHIPIVVHHPAVIVQKRVITEVNPSDDIFARQKVIADHEDLSRWFGDDLALAKVVVRSLFADPLSLLGTELLVFRHSEWVVLD